MDLAYHDISTDRDQIPVILYVLHVVCRVPGYMYMYVCTIKIFHFQTYTVGPDKCLE